MFVQQFVNNIYYSDTAPNIKKIGENLKVTTISNVSEFAFDECLKTIFETNKDIIFHTIQYSKNKQKVYLYADKDVDLTAYKEKQKYRPVTKASEILREIKNVLTSEKCNDPKSISLNRVAEVINEKMMEYEKTKHAFDHSLDYILKSKYGSNSAFIISDFDYVNKRLKLSFNSCVSLDWENSEDIVFYKENDKLYSGNGRDKEISSLVGNYLSKLYDDFMKHKDFMTQSIFRITSNSKFLINITKYGIDVCVPSQGNRFKYDFELSLRSLSNKFDCASNSNNIINSISGRENEIFKRIFVKIEDCPENLRETLYEIRSKELAKKDFVTSLKDKGIQLTKKITTLIKK